jgi:dephospho-CoA kinase
VPFRFINVKRRNSSDHRVLKVGITGGMGSGKTTACKLFEELGVPVYYADERGKYLMQHEHHLIDEIKKKFGNEVYENGKLNRKLLAEKVFNDKLKLEQLNSLVHPAVFHDMECWLNDKEQKNFAYALKEAALLVETGSYRGLDKLVVVTAPLNTRIKRIKDRDALEVEEIMARVRNQLPEEEKVKLADFVIKNDGDLEHLKKQVIKVHRQLVDLHQKKVNG